MPVLQRKIDSISDECCRDFREQLRGATHLSVLCLSGNSYGVGFFEGLSELLAPVAVVERALLSDIFVSRKEEIVPSLRLLGAALSGKQMRYLDLSQNALCPDGMAAVCEAITGNPLTHLLLNHAALSQAGGATLAAALEEGKPPLRVLEVAKNRMEHSVEILANVLSSMGTLEELVAFQNAVRGPAMDALLRAAANCPRLRRLDLSDNSIKEEHRDPLLALVVECPLLSELNVGDCNISAELGDAFFGALSRAAPANLRFLAFSYNDIGDLRGAATCARDCPALVRLEFKHSDHLPADVESATSTLGAVECLWESDDEEEQPAGDLPTEQARMDELLQNLAQLRL